MKKRTFTAVTCLLVLLALATLSQPPSAAAITDPEVLAYYDEFYGCDAGYYPNVENCRENPGYPYDPTESDCRYDSAMTWQGCISGLYQAVPEKPDFCVQARQARDHCAGQYGPNGADPDMMAHMVCYNNSGISSCE